MPGWTRCIRRIANASWQLGARQCAQARRSSRIAGCSIGFGTENYVSFSAIPERDEHGDIVAYIGTCMDITARRRAELALTRANEELEQRVQSRTAELEQANAHLSREVKSAAARNASASRFCSGRRCCTAFPTWPGSRTASCAFSP